MLPEMHIDVGRCGLLFLGAVQENDAFS